MERWLPVVGFEGLYEVSDCGRVRSLDREWIQLSRKGVPHAHKRKGQILRPGPSTCGHLSVVLGRGNTKMVHALVARAFLGEPPKGHECRHKNGIESDNRVGNLEWSTRGRNTQDKKWHKGTIAMKLWPEDVAELKSMFGVIPHWAIADWFGVSVSAVQKIRAGVFHRDV